MGLVGGTPPPLTEGRAEAAQPSGRKASHSGPARTSRWAEMHASMSMRSQAKTKGSTDKDEESKSPKWHWKQFKQVWTSCGAVACGGQVPPECKS